MRAHLWLLVGALAVGIPATARAQTQTTTTTTTTSTTAVTTTSLANEWLASGFVGSNFGASTANSSVTFGGQLGYLWRSYAGAEFLADFTPNFQLSNALLANNPDVNTYMFNAIGAVPLGDNGQWQPYVSGGFGGIQMRSDVFETVGTPGTLSANRTKAGGDLGFGVMGFAQNVGVRADVRYFRAFANDITNPTSAGDVVANNILSGLDFWRANVGVAVRW